jgi:hypothetical protein
MLDSIHWFTVDPIDAFMVPRMTLHVT